MGRRVLLIRNVAPDKYGGGESYQIMLASELKKNGFSPVIVTASEKLLERAGVSGIETVKAPYFKLQNYSGWRNVLLPVYMTWQLWLKHWYGKLFREYKPEVVNIESRDEWIAATRAGLKCGVKVLWTDHIDFRTWVMMNVKVPYKNMIGKYILKYAKKVEKVIFVSDYEKKWFVENCGKLQNIVVIKNGAIDKRNEYAEVKSRKKSFCYVGRLVDYKGIRELIEAFREIDDAGARLNIYGAGEVREYRKSVGGDERIRFYGHTDEPLRKIAENEVFVLPSYYEGLSLTLVDAAMMGKRIIATDVDGNPEVVGNGAGILVPAKNVRKLRDALGEMILNRREGEKMAKMARKRYEEEFNFEKIFEKEMLKLYNIRKEQ